VPKKTPEKGISYGFFIVIKKRLFMKKSPVIVNKLAAVELKTNKDNGTFLRFSKHQGSLSRGLYRIEQYKPLTKLVSYGH
jgi:hypothetical protein